MPAQRSLGIRCPLANTRTVAVKTYIFNAAIYGSQAQRTHSKAIVASRLQKIKKPLSIWSLLAHADAFLHTTLEPPLPLPLPLPLQATAAATVTAFVNPFTQLLLPLLLLVLRPHSFSPPASC